MERELQSIENSLRDSDLTSGLESIQRLLNKHKSSHSSLHQILNRLYSFSQFLISQKLFRTIFPLFQILEKLCQILKDYSRLCDLKNSLSFCYRNSGQVNLALKECLEALELASEQKSLIVKLPALHLNACAIFREDLKDLVMAKTHAELAYFFAKENCVLSNEKDKKTLSVACYNYAAILEEMKDKASALVWYKEGLKFCEEKWDDVYMEQVFREKVNNLAYVDNMKRTVISKRKIVSNRYNNAYKSGKDRGRPMTYRNQGWGNKYTLTPINGKTGPVGHGSLERRSLNYEYEKERKVKRTETPASSSKGARVYSESSRSTHKQKLSLVQSVIKIQKWFRKICGKQTFFFKYFYVGMAIRVFFGVKYFVCISREIKRNGKVDGLYLVEAWPLVRQIKKPSSLEVTLEELGDFASAPNNENDLKNRFFILNHSIQVVQGKLQLSKIVPIFEGTRYVSNKTYTILILFINRNLEIQASTSSTHLSCSVKLDPLHDETNIKSKINLILDNLEVKSEQLLFNLM